MERHDRIALFYVGAKSKALGTVRNLPLSFGSYSVRYKLFKEDATNLLFGFEQLSKLLFSMGARRLYLSVKGVPSFDSNEAVAEYLQNPPLLKNLDLATIHSYSSCPLGEKEDYAALDSHGKLRGFTNMYVNDASMLPTSPGVNPQGPLMALALRNIEYNFKNL